MTPAPTEIDVPHLPRLELPLLLLLLLAAGGDSERRRGGTRRKTESQGLQLTPASFGRLPLRLYQAWRRRPWSLSSCRLDFYPAVLTEGRATTSSGVWSAPLGSDAMAVTISMLCPRQRARPSAQPPDDARQPTRGHLRGRAGWLLAWPARPGPIRLYRPRTLVCSLASVCGRYRLPRRGSSARVRPCRQLQQR